MSYFLNIWNYLTASGTCNKDDNSSWSCMDVFGCTKPPWFDNTEYEPTRTLLATVCLNTSTFNVSVKISSVSYEIISMISIPKEKKLRLFLSIILALSRSGCTKATWSLQAITLPRADSLSSTLCTLTLSGREFRICCSSVSVVVFGTNNPFLFPVQIYFSCLKLLSKHGYF